MNNWTVVVMKSNSSKRQYGIWNASVIGLIIFSFGCMILRYSGMGGEFSWNVIWEPFCYSLPSIAALFFIANHIPGKSKNEHDLALIFLLTLGICFFISIIALGEVLVNLNALNTQIVIITNVLGGVLGVVWLLLAVLPVFRRLWWVGLPLLVFSLVQILLWMRFFSLLAIMD